MVHATRTHVVAGGEKTDEVGGDQRGSLVDELEVGMLPVGTGGPPHDRTGGDRHRSPSPVHRLAVALHVQLLEIGGKTPEIMAVGQHRMGLRTEEVPVPQAEQTEQHR